MLTGMDPRAANITSTVALFPAQLVTGFTGRADAETPPGLTMRTLILISLVGGAIGALILLATPPSVFARLVPWLVLFATALFAWGSFFRRSVDDVEGRLPPWGMGTIQFFIAVYGGYFGGGIGFMMMAALTMTGIAVRNAGAAKNILAGMANASAVLIFVFSRDVHWAPALITAAGASFAKTRSTAVAMIALESTGSSSRLRPQSPIMASVSKGPNPSPPCSVGTVMASTPNSARPRHTSESHPADERLID